MEKKIYFISDLHLGLYPPEKSKEREKIAVQWLDSIKHETSELYLMGDVFDFWHEYKRVVPRGFTRFLGKLGELSDMGIQIHFFTGNHDIWAYDYLPKEIGLTLYRKPVVREINGLTFFLAHGDGLGPGDHRYKILKKFFTNRALQWMFARLHPNLAVTIGLTWSKKSRYAKGIVAEDFAGEEKEWQILFAKEKLAKAHIDFFIFGHRHIPSDLRINHSRVINLGDWINNFSYAALHGQQLELHSIYPELEEHIIRN